MKIDTAPPRPLNPPTRLTAGGRPGASMDARQDKTFEVHISAAAARQVPADSLQDDEELRRARVAAIRDQLASGSYNISGRDVANKILEALKG